MPYSANAYLPPSVRNHLPSHAQDIYREAFNHAYARIQPQREEAALRIAWTIHQNAGGEWAVRNG